MIAVIDGDIIAYRAAAACNNETLPVAEATVNDMVRNILRSVGATEQAIWLSGEESYRRQLCPTYKANRTREKPHLLEPLKEHLVEFWGAAKSSDGLEADDEIGLMSTRYWEDGVPFVVVSIDKDLKQLCGPNYNFVTQERTFISPNDSVKAFWSQMLIGDSSDNIKGVLGVGKVKAERILGPLVHETDMYDVVENLYSDKERFNINAQLLWILKHQRSPTEVLSNFLTIQKPSVENQ